MFNLPDFNLLMALLLSRVALAGGGEDPAAEITHQHTPHSGTATVEVGLSWRHEEC